MFWQGTWAESTTDGAVRLPPSSPGSTSSSTRISGETPPGISSPEPTQQLSRVAWTSIRTNSLSTEWTWGQGRKLLRWPLHSQRAAQEHCSIIIDTIGYLPKAEAEEKTVAVRMHWLQRNAVHLGVHTRVAEGTADNYPGSGRQGGGVGNPVKKTTATRINHIFLSLLLVARARPNPHATTARTKAPADGSGMVNARLSIAHFGAKMSTLTRPSAKPGVN